MKIKIEDDVFEIVNRIKEIDEGYFVVFDTRKNVYEIHNSQQENTFCLTVPYGCLDSRVLELVMVTNIKHYDNIIDEIDNNNNLLCLKQKENIKSQTDYMLREIYEFCNNSSKKFNEKSFQTEWR
jgi:hypothetical protein